MELTRRAAIAAAVAAAVAAPLRGAGPDPRVVETREAVKLLVEFAALPSPSGDAAGAGRAARWAQDRFSELGFTTQDLSAGGNPLVLAERAAARPAPIVLFYMHYDTQPAGPKEDWASTGGDPFRPRLLTGPWDASGTRPIDPDSLEAASLEAARVYARGIADDKAPIVMHLRALKRWLATPAAGRLHLKYLLDGEEEAGSPHIAAALERSGDRLRADLMVLCDGPMDALGRPSVYLGARGDMHMRLRLRTAKLPAHSGNYGLLPNAAWRLADLLATMKDASGRVTIEGFEDDVSPPTPDQRETLAAASRAEPAIAAQLGASRFEGDPAVPYYERLLFHPGLIINQLASGRPGNQIPVEAEALLEVRLVARQDPMKVYETVLRHVLARAPQAELEFIEGTPADGMDPADPVIARAIAAATKAAGGKLLVYPSLGGTLPLLRTFAARGHRYVGLPLVNFDNNQHVGNENLKVGALPDGIELLVRLLDELAAPSGS